MFAENPGIIVEKSWNNRGILKSATARHNLDNNMSLKQPISMVRQ